MSSPPQHHEPMVAMICPEKTGEKLGKLYHNQYMSAEGKWTTDFDHKATCRQDKVEILEYCKKVYHTFGLIYFLKEHSYFHGPELLQDTYLDLHENWKNISTKM